METICMKCQILFSGKNKKNIINLLSAENAQRVVKVNSLDSISNMRGVWLVFVITMFYRNACI